MRASSKHADMLTSDCRLVLGGWFSRRQTSTGWSAPVAGVLAALRAVVVRTVAGAVVVVAALEERLRVLVTVAEERLPVLGTVAERRRDVVALAIGAVDRFAPTALVVTASHSGNSILLGSSQQLLET
jgi:hypothetical protein